MDNQTDYDKIKELEMSSYEKIGNLKIDSLITISKISSVFSAIIDDLSSNRSELLDKIKEAVLSTDVVYADTEWQINVPQAVIDTGRYSSYSINYQNGKWMLSSNDDTSEDIDLYYYSDNTDLYASEVVFDRCSEGYPTAYAKRTIQTKNALGIATFLDVAKTKTTKIEVFPTDTVIPAGTTDSFDGLKEVFGWDELDFSLTSQTFTGYKYTNDVPSCDTLYLQMYLCPKSRRESDIIIDWGDGTLQILNEWTPNGSKYEYYQDWQPSGYPYSEVMVSHKYEGQYLNRKNIVSLYGKDFFMLRGLYESTAAKVKQYTGKDCSNLVSRVFERDLPVHQGLKNASSICGGSKRILRIVMPYEYPHGITNISNAFLNATNLKYVDMDESAFDKQLTYSCGSMFAGCTSLEYSNFVIPPFVATGGANSIYKGCINLSVDIASLLPKCGFFGSRYNMSNVFAQCSSLYGEVPSYMHDVHSYEMFSVGIGTLTSHLPEQVETGISCKSWMCLPAIVDNVPEKPNVIGKNATVVTALPETAEVGQLFYLSKTYRDFKNYSLVEMTDNGYKLVGERYREIFFLSADAQIDLDGSGDKTLVHEGEILYLQSLTTNGSGPYHWEIIPENRRTIFLNNSWTGPDGIEYKPNCLYQVALVDGTYKYQLVKDLTEYNKSYILRYNDPSTGAKAGQLWAFTSEPSPHYKFSKEEAVGNALEGCNESVLSSAPKYLGGYVSNPSYSKELSLAGKTIDLSEMSEVDVISTLVEALGGNVITVQQ